MEIPVLVRPTETGFRATTGQPFDFSEEAPSSEAAIAAVRGRIAAMLRDGVKVVGVKLDDAEFLHAWHGLATDPTFDAFLEEMRAYRQAHDAQVEATPEPSLP